MIDPCIAIVRSLSIELDALRQTYNNRLLKLARVGSELALQQRIFMSGQVEALNTAILRIDRIVIEMENSQNDPRS